jgi:hypothetical protein
MSAGTSRSEGTSRRIFYIASARRYITPARPLQALSCLQFFTDPLFFSLKSVGMALCSIIGGSSGGFHLVCVKPCHFRFSVTSKAVGFLVRALKRITTMNFDVYFHLWRDGGANWQRELHDWEDEEERQWTLVTKKKSPKAKHVRFSSPIKLPSPILKKSPVLGISNIKFGSFSCQLQNPPLPAVDRSTASPSAIPVSRVFGSLKSQLISNSNLA